MPDGMVSRKIAFDFTGAGYVHLRTGSLWAVGFEGYYWSHTAIVFISTNLIRFRRFLVCDRMVSWCTDMILPALGLLIRMLAH